MPYRVYEIRVKKYELNVIPDVVRTKFEALKPLMLDEQKKRQAEITDIETKVRQLLDDKGIFGIFRVPYLNVGRMLYRAKTRVAGVALQKYATAVKAYAVAQGLDPSIVDEIIKIVIGAPAY